MMNIQYYLLSVLYILLILVHTWTLTQTAFRRNLISIFSFALFTETLSTILFTVDQIVLTYRQKLSEMTTIDLSLFKNLHYLAHFIHLTAINFLILFLLIIAKGWPITRRKITFRIPFATFWFMCLMIDLVTFYWTTINLLARSLTDKTMLILPHQNFTPDMMPSSTEQPTPVVSSSPNSITETLSTDTEYETINSTPRRLSLLLRIIIMSYFLMELRATMILEQDKKKLQFYLKFGALSMVWFVHSVIVYVISLRVDLVWQSKIISGFSSTANFLAFAIITRVLGPMSTESYLFKRAQSSANVEMQELGRIASSDT